MNAQVIVTPHGERLVVLPEAEYRILVEAAEDAADAEAIRRFEAALQAGEEELIPSEVVNRLLGGENKVRIWREFRGLTIEDAAAQAGISQARLLNVENGSESPDRAALEALAPVLKVDPEDLWPRSE